MEESGESSELVANFIVSILEEYGLDFNRLTSFCADNAPVNFGGPTLMSERTNRDKEKNVFKRLQERKKNLVPIGCPAHILHNAAQKAAERLPVDIEAIVFKLTSYFKGSTLRHEKLKEFCKFVEVNYATLPSHTPTRWTTLKSVLDRMVELWYAIRELFASMDKPPKMLEDFFNSDEAQIVVYFLQSILLTFEKPLILLQRTTALLPELVDIMNSFKSKIISRQQSSFYGATTSTKLGRLLDQTRVEVLKSSFEEFYSTVKEYVAKWFHSEYLPSNMSWIMLSIPEVSYADVQALASQINPGIAELDSLFDEVTVLNSLIEQVPTQVFNAIGAEEKWIKIFADNEDSLPGIFLLVSAVFSIPVSNAFIERIFSLCGVQWTKEKNSLHVNTVKSVVQTKVNFDFSCPQMYSYLLKSNVLLTKIRSWEKYF